MEINKFDSVWKRVRELTGWSKKGELADFLGIRRQSVSGAIKRRGFPLDWAYKIAVAYDSNTDWIIDDRGQSHHFTDGNCKHDLPINRNGHMFAEFPAFEPGLLRYIHEEFSRFKEEKALELTKAQKTDITYLTYNLCQDCNKNEALAICFIVQGWLGKTSKDKNEYID